MAGYWKAPRALATMLARRELTPSQYALLNFICQSGADRPGGYVTTNGLLASVLDVNEKTVRRALRDLRAKDLLAFDDHERVAAFAIRSADTLRTLEGVSMSAPMSAPMSAALRTHPPADDPPGGIVERETGAPPCGHGSGTETETETETETSAYSRELTLAASTSLDTRANPGTLVASFIDQTRKLTGNRPPKRVVGMVAGQLGALAAEGFTEDTLRAALALMLARRLHPTTLPTLVLEAQAGPPAPKREHIADRMLRSVRDDAQGGAT